MGNFKSIVRGTQSAYTALATKDNDTLYFIKDKGYLILRNANGNDVKYGNGFSNLSYNQATHILTFTKADGTTETFDCSPFIYQGMIDDVKIVNVTNFDSNTGYSVGDYVYRSTDQKVYKFKVEHRGAWSDADVDEIPGLSAAGGYLFIDFNTEAGKTDIYIPLTSIFNPANYYTKSQIDSSLGGKADKVSGATNGNFAGLDANGNLTDSGKKASDFATAAQGTKADSAIQSVKVNGTALTPGANKSVNIPTADSNTFGVSKLFGTEVAGSDSVVGSYSAIYINSNFQKGIAIVDLD